MKEPLKVDGAVTIVGASLAGLRSAEALRREGFAGTITMIGDEVHHPYDRPPLSKQLLSGEWSVDKIVLGDATKLSELGITARLGQRATGLDAEAKRVTLADGTQVEGDAVVIATGAALRRLPGSEGLEHVHGLRTLDDALALRGDLDALEPGSRVVLIGAGFIGQEVATEAHRRGHKVTILEMLEVPLSPIVGEPVAELLLGLSAAQDVELRCSVRVSGIEAPRDGAIAGRVGIEGGEPIPADLIVFGIGVVPHTDWLEGSGLGIDGGVLCDEHLFAAPGIVAAGDVARFRWLGSGHDEVVRIEHWQMAADHGAHVAKALLGGPHNAPVFDAVPYFWSDQWGKKIQVLGHPAASDTAEVVLVPDEEGRFVALFHEGSFLTGAIGVSRPRQLMAFRPLLARGATIDDALEVSL
jgi:3-phenylpropionate/trans-cinnamate dioxygenase ferredoxin reductase subunit